ncbi:MAG: GGDEF domain-containing protein [Myxococcota bacterium]
MNIDAAIGGGVGMGTGQPEITKVSPSYDRLLECEGQPCVIQLYGQNIGRRYPLDAQETVIGRADPAHIQIDHESVSRRHARIVMHKHGSTLFDEGSTNGSYVNDRRVERCELRDGDLVRIGQTIFKYLSASNLEAKYHEEIYRLTTVDALTGAYNKRYFFETLEAELNRSQRYMRSLSLIMIDIDHFKGINDDYGHLIGDAVLTELAQRVSRAVRRQDLFARYGGEEFAILLPEVRLEGARRAAEKVRQILANQPFRIGSEQISVTVSLGVATTDGTQGYNSATFVATADGMLYSAKTLGRNRVGG